MNLPYLVLLARPDYVYGANLETYLTTAYGDTPQAAVDAARLDAARLEAAECDGGEPDAAIDYAVLLVIQGEHADLTHLIDQGV